MDYSTALVQTTADCDLLLDSAAIEKEDLQFKRLQQERQYKTVTTGTTGVEAELISVNSEITGIENVVAGLPAGETKDQFESNLVKLRYKKFILEERREKYGIIALLEKEYTIACIDKQLEENQAYIDLVTVRKSAL